MQAAVPLTVFPSLEATRRTRRAPPKSCSTSSDACPSEALRPSAATGLAETTGQTPHIAFDCSIICPECQGRRGVPKPHPLLPFRPLTLGAARGASPTPEAREGPLRGPVHCRMIFTMSPTPLSIAHRPAGPLPSAAHALPRALFSLSVCVSPAPAVRAASLQG